MFCYVFPNRGPTSRFNFVGSLLLLPTCSAINPGEATAELRFVSATKNRDPPKSWGIFFGAIPCFALLGAISGGLLIGQLVGVLLDEVLVGHMKEWLVGGGHKDGLEFRNLWEILFGMATDMKQMLWLTQS